MTSAPDQPGEGLPAPTGPYAVGRTTYHWRDERRDERCSPDTDGKRELVVWVWYPAGPASDADRAAYLPAGWEAVGQFWGFQAAGLRSHAVANAPLAIDQTRYPVLVFSPAGFPPLSLAATLEEIASHGYVVVGINHTYESTVSVFPDGRILAMNTDWMQPVLGPFSGSHEDAFRGRAAVADLKAADLRFVVDQVEALEAGSDRFGGRLDLARLGAFGHSLGGNAALEYCRLDRRCLAAANLDGGNWNAVGKLGLERPALLILADHTEVRLPCETLVQQGLYPSPAWCEAERALMLGGWQTVYERAQPGYGVLIRGSAHISFMDVPFLPVEPGSMVAGGLAAVRIDSRRAWQITCAYLLAFFGKHLSGTPTPLLDSPSPSPDYPEVALGAPLDLLVGETPSGPATQSPP
jgi:hypothetical protein